MRFHILGVPHTITSKEYVACAFTQKVLKFCKMMTDLGHEVIHYGHEHSEVQCTEHVTVVPDDIYRMNYGNADPSKVYKFDNHKDLAYLVFWENACREIDIRKQPGDFLLPFFGVGVQKVCDVHSDMIVVEPGIGYVNGMFAKYKVFESYAIYHAYCGMEGVKYGNQKWYETVIPNYFDKDDFTYKEDKDDYILYLGRVVTPKGIDLAAAVTKQAGKKLIIAGQMDDEDPFDVPDHCEYVGLADNEKRRELLSNAKALILPSLYVEPFGGVQIEALLSGTPTITTDWGAFVENNHNGITGFRCRTPSDFRFALKHIDEINPSTCRQVGLGFTLEPIGKRYVKYFTELLKFEQMSDKINT
jgi:glycosyltransferase involved in cell wall biosynthesis